MSNLTNIITRRPDGTYSVSYVGTPVEMNRANSRLKLTLDKPLVGIDSIKSYNDNISGGNANNYISKYFKYDNGNGMSDMLPIDQLTGITISPCSELNVEIIFVYTSDDNSNGSIYVNGVQYGGDYTLSVYDSQAYMKGVGDSAILSPYDIYKVFRLDDFQVLSNHGDYDIKFRFTQSNGKSYSDYIPLTKENLQRAKVDKLRFVQFEYHITNNGSPLMVYDIILLGDFQNVNANYMKTNRYGLKEDCVNGMNSTPGQNTNLLTDGLSCYKDQYALLNTQNTDNASNLYKPYQTAGITSFANMLGNQISSLVGWNVDYHLTDPDGGGIDTYIHEYTLKNVVDMKTIQVVVPENKFPTETVMINQFNLNLFDTFEIHIMKDVFKNAFGVVKRPSEDDMMYFCESNAIFTVKHAQAKKDVMNAATYYKVVLEKYEQRAHVRNQLKESADAIAALTDNTTLDSLFGEVNLMEEKNIANKEQTKPRSMELVRHKIFTGISIVDTKVIIDNFEPIRSYYDLSDPKMAGKVAVDYKKADQLLSKGDNRSFIFWTKFNNMHSDDSAVSKDVIASYNIKGGVDFVLLNNYDATNNVGYEIKYRGGMLHFKINDKAYSVNCELMTNVWYGFVINMNQRVRTIDFNVFRRNSDIEILMYNPNTYEKDYISYKETSAISDLISQGFVKLDNDESVFCTGMERVVFEMVDHEPSEYAADLVLKLYGSNMSETNIRVLTEVIPQDKLVGTMLEYVLTDEKYVILADNSGKKLVTTNYVNINWK